MLQGWGAGTRDCGLWGTKAGARKAPRRLPLSTEMPLLHPRGRESQVAPQPLPGVAPRPEKDLGRGSRAPRSYLFPYLAPGGPWGGGTAGWGPQGRPFRAAHWRLRPALRSLRPSLLPPLLRASRPRLRRSEVGANRAGRAPRPTYGRGGASRWAGPLWGVVRITPPTCGEPRPHSQGQGPSAGALGFEVSGPF